MLPQPTGLLKIVLNMFFMINVQGRNLFLHNFAKYAFNVGLRSNVMSLFVLNLAW